MKDKMIIPSPKAYADAITSGCLNPIQLKTLQTLYGFPAHSATAGQIAAVMGYSRYNVTNLRIGNAEKALSKALKIKPPYSSERGNHWWSILADGDDSGRYFLWIMRPQLVKALETLGLTNEIGIDIQTDEYAQIKEYEEGHKISVAVNIYERSREARQQCVAHYGFICAVCGFDFQKVYGETGNEYIHVHHIVPLSQVNQKYIIDPIRDLRPVCPNCHAMIHRRSTTLTIDELKNRIKSRNNT